MSSSRDNPSSYGERLVKVETVQENQDRMIEDVVDRLDSLDTKVGKILEKMEKHSGFFHGVIFAFSIIGALIGAFSAEIWKKLTAN
jgi:ribulose kinase